MSYAAQEEELLLFPEIGTRGTHRQTPKEDQEILSVLKLLEKAEDRFYASSRRWYDLAEAYE